MFSAFLRRFRDDRAFAFRTVCTVMFAVGMLLYANSFNNALFWDDQDGILKNVYIRDWSNLPKFFSENLIAGSSLVSNYWRPLLLIGYAAEWHLWGAAPFGYHVDSTLIHIAAAILAYLLLDRMFRRRALAFLTALVFLIHPLQTEAVTYVSGRGDPLAILLMLGSILLFLKHRDDGDRKREDPIYWGSLALFVLALLTKETSIALPALVVLCDYFANGRGKPLKKYVLEILNAAWPFILLLGGYVLLRLTVLNFNNIMNLYGAETEFTSNFHVRLFTFFRVMTIYAGLLFAPYTLYMERTVQVANSFWAPDVLAGAAICAGLVAAAVASWKKMPEVSFGIAWFFIRILPNTNLLVPNAALLYEHWLYSPLLGWYFALFAAAAAGLAWYARRMANRESHIANRISQMANRESHLANRTSRMAICDLRFAAYVLLAVGLVFLGVRTVLRNRDWHDPMTFYEQTLRYATPTYRVLNNLGMAYDDAGRIEDARATYQRAVDIDPANPVGHHNLGNLWKNLGDNGRAVEEFEKALSLNPGFLFSYRSLAAMYLEQKKYPEARAVLERYLKQTSDIAVQQQILGVLSQVARAQGNNEASDAYAAQAEGNAARQGR